MSEQMTRRNREIKRLVIENGLTTMAVGEMFGISRQRVYQILQAQGISRLPRIMERQKEQLLSFIIGYKYMHDGVAPNAKEMVDGCNRINSSTSISFVIKELVKDGAIRHNDDAVGSNRTYRTMQVVGGNWYLLRR